MSLTGNTSEFHDMQQQERSLVIVLHPTTPCSTGATLPHHNLHRRIKLATDNKGMNQTSLSP